MNILLGAGVAVAALGAVVLLLFPDRPGGRIAWHGAEVSSVGAGLPLIVLGVAAIAFAATRGSGETPAAPAAPAGPAAGEAASGAGGGCPASYFAGVGAGRVVTLEEGAHDVDIVAAGQPLDEPVGLRLTADGRPVGAVRLRYFPSSRVFRLESVRDGRCREAQDVRDADHPGGDGHRLQNYGTARLTLGGRTYDIRFLADSSIHVNFLAVAGAG